MVRTFMALTWLACGQAAAGDLERFAKGDALFAAAVRAFAPDSRAEAQVLGRAPLADLLARRDAASVPVSAGGQEFLLTPVFDSAWNVYLSIKPRGEAGPAGVWKEDLLKAGVEYSHAGLALRIKDDGGVLRLSWDNGSAETSMAELFDQLYAGSAKAAFGKAVTYALIRNVEPATGKDGTVTLRLGSDGLYYYSLTQDSEIQTAPRWLLAVNGVLYGIRIEGADLVFLAKVIEDIPKFLRAERAFPPRRPSR